MVARLTAMFTEPVLFQCRERNSLGFESAAATRSNSQCPRFQVCLRARQHGYVVAHQGLLPVARVCVLYRLRPLLVYGKAYTSDPYYRPCLVEEMSKRCTRIQLCTLYSTRQPHHKYCQSAPGTAIALKRRFAAVPLRKCDRQWERHTKPAGNGSGN